VTGSKLVYDETHIGPVVIKLGWPKLQWDQLVWANSWPRFAVDPVFDSGVDEQLVHFRVQRSKDQASFGCNFQMKRAGRNVIGAKRGWTEHQGTTELGIGFTVVSVVSSSLDSAVN
jgi:hypothetical protein